MTVYGVGRVDAVHCGRSWRGHEQYVDEVLIGDQATPTGLETQ